MPAGESPPICKTKGAQAPAFFWFFSLLIPHVRVHDTHTTPLGWVYKGVVCVMHRLWFLFGSFSLRVRRGGGSPILMCGLVEAVC